MARAHVAFSTAGTLAVVLAGSACGGGETKAGRPALDELDSLLSPAALAAALKGTGGARVRGAWKFRVSAAGKRQPQDTLTTKTDLTIDRQGNFRLFEENDHDGGREVVLHGRDLAVGLRHGRLVRRPAQEPEPTRYLEEALGGPWAAWEVARRFVAAERTAPGAYKLSRASRAVPVPAGLVPGGALRKWRDTLQVHKLEGEAQVDEKTGLLTLFKLQAEFAATREDQPVEGELAVITRLEGVGTTAPVAAPDTTSLPPRQRTILEERALLDNLAPRGAPPGAASDKGAP